MKRVFWTAHITLLTYALSGCVTQDPCTTTELEDGSVILQCGDEPPVTISGSGGPAGEAGEPGARGPQGEDGRPGEDGERGEDGQSAALRTESATPDQCAYGGEVVYTGYDTDDSGALEPGEETRNFIICQGAPGDGKTAIVVSSQADLGDCPEGGRRVEVGLDADQSGSLEPDEILDAFNICNGASGDMGEGGASALIEVVVDGALTCVAGGDLIHVGVDADRDGTLSQAERSGSFDVCDGEDGSSCSVVDNNDGTKTISCTDGTTATVTDGGSCSASDNGDGTKTISCTDGSSVIVSNGEAALISVTQGGAQGCANGGDLVDVGVDADANGVLDPSEITDTFEVCQGLDGADGVAGQDGSHALVSLTSNGAQSCPAGGDLLEVGADLDNDGVLDASEVNASFEVCDGADGATGQDGVNGIDGQDGSSCSVTDHGNGTKTIFCTDGSSATVSDGRDGANALIRTVEGGATACPNGGDLIQAGVDDNNNGVLDPSEVDSDVEVCDGQDGVDGSSGQDGVAGQDGLTSLIKVTEEPAGANCSSGGQKIEVGLDQNGNGTLDVSEIDGALTTFICSDGANQGPFQALDIELGYNFACAVTTTGGAMCWGGGLQGQLGDGTGSDIPSPTGVLGLSSGVSQIAVGYTHACALTTSGGVKCWGTGSQGRLGDGFDTRRNSPVDVVGLSSGVASISAGSLHTCAVTTAGAVKCWGSNAGGQLGDGSTTNSHVPVDVSGLSAGVQAVSASVQHTCALTNNGGVKCWGNGGRGRLGNNSTATSLVPVDVSGLTSGVSSITTGDAHGCAVTTTGGLKCWGQNYSGQLGDGTSTDRLTPVDVVGLTSGVAAVAGAQQHTCAVLTSGDAKCWGSGAFGRLGDGMSQTSFTPVDMINLDGGVRALDLGPSGGCLLTNADVAKCWGSNNNGQHGRGFYGGGALSPVSVLQ